MMWPLRKPCRSRATRALKPSPSILVEDFTRGERHRVRVKSKRIRLVARRVLRNAPATLEGRQIGLRERNSVGVGCRALNIEHECGTRRDLPGGNHGRMIVVGRDRTGDVGGRNLTWAGGVFAATLVDRDDATRKQRQRRFKRELTTRRQRGRFERFHAIRPRIPPCPLLLTQ